MTIYEFFYLIGGVAIGGSLIGIWYENKMAKMLQSILDDTKVILGNRMELDK